MRTRTLRSLIYLAGGLGVIVSIFATAEFFDASLRNICTVSSFFSCALVDQSGKTTTLGIPDYAWGIGGFVVILVVAAIGEARSEVRGWTYALLGLTTAGVGLSLYLLYVELVLIGALCLVCTSAYLLGALAWVGSIALVRRTGDTGGPTETDEGDEGASAASE